MKTELTTIAENADASDEDLEIESESHSFKTIPEAQPAQLPKGIVILEETDSDGISPPLKYWKRKGRDITSGLGNEGCAESDNDLKPSKKPKITNDTDMEPAKKIKNTVCEAIAAIQQVQPVSSADNSQLEASEKREVAAKGIQPRPVVSTDKCLGTGPQWNQQLGRKHLEGDRSITNPNQKDTRRDLPADSDAIVTYVIVLLF